MKPVIDNAQELVRGFRNTRISEVRATLSKTPALNSATIERMVKRELKKESCDVEYLQALANALIALLPLSSRAIERLLSVANPRCIYELHFSLFGALNRADFNDLEQDGIEYLLMRYLSGVRSTSSYAAWKAGLVLGEDWLSPRSEALLIRLMMSAKFPAGRMGAVNGYRFVIERGKKFTAEELSPLRIVARSDKSAKVREDAKFHLARLRKMLIARNSTITSDALTS